MDREEKLRAAKERVSKWLDSHLADNFKRTYLIVLLTNNEYTRSVNCNVQSFISAQKIPEKAS